MMISDAVETVTFETETWLKLRDRDFKNPETETRDFKISAFCRFCKKKVVITSKLNFFQISGIFPTGFVVSYLQTQQTKVVEL